MHPSQSGFGVTDGRGSRFDAAASAAVARLQASMHHHSPTLAASDYSGSGLAAPGDHSVVGHVGGSAGYWDTERSGVDAERGEINSFVDDILGDESTDQAMRYALRHSPPAHATQASRTGASAGPPAGGSGGSGSASAAAAAINDAAFSPSPGTRGARSAADGADSGGFGSSSSSSSSGGGSSSKASGAGPSSLDGRAPSADAVLKLSADNAEYDWSDDGSDYGDDGVCGTGSGALRNSSNGAPEPRSRNSSSSSSSSSSGGSGGGSRSGSRDRSRTGSGSAPVGYDESHGGYDITLPHSPPPIKAGLAGLLQRAAAWLGLGGAAGAGAGAGTGGGGRRGLERLSGGAGQGGSKLQPEPYLLWGIVDAQRVTCNVSHFAILVLVLLTLGMSLLVPGCAMRFNGSPEPSPLLELNLCPEMPASSYPGQGLSYPATVGGYTDGRRPPSGSAASAPVDALFDSIVGTSGGAAATSTSSSPRTTYYGTGQPCDLASLQGDDALLSQRLPVHKHMLETGVSYVPYLLFPENVEGYVSFALLRRRPDASSRPAPHSAAGGAAAGTGAASFVEVFSSAEGSSTAQVASTAGPGAAEAAAAAESAAVAEAAAAELAAGDVGASTAGSEAFEGHDVVFAITQAVGPVGRREELAARGGDVVYSAGQVPERSQMPMYSEMRFAGTGAGADCADAVAGCLVSVSGTLNQIVVRGAHFTVPRSQRMSEGTRAWAREPATGLVLVVTRARIRYTQPYSSSSSSPDTGFADSAGGDDGSGFPSPVVGGDVDGSSQPSVSIGFLQYTLTPMQARGVPLILWGGLVVVVALALAWYSITLDSSKAKPL